MNDDEIKHAAVKRLLGRRHDWYFNGTNLVCQACGEKVNFRGSHWVTWYRTQERRTDCLGDI